MKEKKSQVTSTTRQKRKTPKKGEIPPSELMRVEDVNSLAVHSIAEEFPRIADEQFNALVEDIKEFGIRQPILVADGVLIDGRNRLRAAIEAEHLTVPVRQLGKLSEQEIRQVITSANSLRRHQSKAELARAANRHIQDMKDAGTPVNKADAAKLFGVSVRYLNHVKHPKSDIERKQTTTVAIPKALKPLVARLKEKAKLPGFATAIEDIEKILSSID